MNILIINNSKLLTEEIKKHLPLQKEDEVIYISPNKNDHEKALKTLEIQRSLLILFHPLTLANDELSLIKKLRACPVPHSPIILFLSPQPLSGEKLGQLAEVEANDILTINELDQLKGWYHFAHRKLKNPLEDLLVEKKKTQIEERYHHFFDNLSVGFFQSTPQGKLLSANSAFAKLLGYDSPQALKKEVKNIALDLYVKPQRRQEYLEILKKNGRVIEFHAAMYQRDRSVVWVSENAHAIFDHQGNPIQLEGTLIDITGHLETEEKLRRSSEELKKASLELNMNELQLSITFSEMERINKIFKMFVPDQFLNRIHSEQSNFFESGIFEEENLSILFGDIRDYTKLAEVMSPQENFKFLNSIFSLLDSPISQNEGFIDKFIGDAVMALFDNESSAEHAVQAAVHIQKAIHEYNKRRSKKGYQEINFGIGINTGSIMFGVLGSPTRLNSTVIGDHVNLSARVEQLTKRYKAQILITHYTYNQINPEHFSIREIDTIKVRGRKTPVMIYEVFDMNPPELKEKKLKAKEFLQSGIILYKSQFFTEALSSFQKSVAIFPEDLVALEYIKRCIFYLTSPPENQFWDAISDPPNPLKSSLE